MTVVLELPSEAVAKGARVGVEPGAEAPRLRVDCALNAGQRAHSELALWAAVRRDDIEWTLEDDESARGDDGAAARRLLRIELEMRELERWERPFREVAMDQLVMLQISRPETPA